VIRIASGQAFWGDWPQAPALQVRSGPIDYLVLDYLAEVTVAILEKQKARDPSRGYAHDFVTDVGGLLPELMERGIKVISSAGGAAPRACAEALLAKASELGVTGLKVAVIEGADVFHRLGSPVGSGIGLRALDGETLGLSEIGPRFTSAHAYLGAEPIVRALRQGAHVVVTGRCTDSALALAPIMYEFDIAPDDWDALALGIVVGHVLECGAQSTGGNYLADWRAVPHPEVIGFPIAEMEGPDRAVITKHASLGGLVNAASVKEQLLYEIGDPRAYVTPDCIADFTTIELHDEGRDRVVLSGVRGRPAPVTLKVSCVYSAGWKVTGQITYCWPEALEKAQAAGDLVRRRTEAVVGEPFEEWLAEYVGAGTCFGSLGQMATPDEVVLRVSARSRDRAACERLGRELVGLVLTGPPGATGYAAGRPRPTEVSGIWSGLVSRAEIEATVEVLG
jgi:hypothetical protein